MKVEVDVLGSPYLIALIVSVDVKQHSTYFRAQECVKVRSCVKVEVDVLGSPSQIVLMVSVDVRQN